MKREQIDKEINICIDQMLSDEAGIIGESVLSKMITYHGAPPAPSGNDQSNMAMITAMRKLRNTHHDFKDIFNVVIRLRDRDWRPIAALMSIHYYRGLNKDTKKTFTNIDRAAKIGLPRGSFNYFVNLGYQAYGEMRGG